MVKPSGLSKESRAEKAEPSGPIRVGHLRWPSEVGRVKWARAWNWRHNRAEPREMAELKGLRRNGRV